MRGNGIDEQVAKPLSRSCSVAVLSGVNVTSQ
jgi:hypothetical protein